MTITANFNCAINTFGIHPEYTDYYIEVPINNTGFEPPILLARRGALNGTSDTFNVTVRSFVLRRSRYSKLFYFIPQVPYSNYVANAGHVVMLETTYPVNGTNGTPYSIVGGIEAPIIIHV